MGTGRVTYHVFGKKYEKGPGFFISPIEFDAEPHFNVPGDILDIRTTVDAAPDIHPSFIELTDPKGRSTF
jgi:hypothetical protein